MLRKSNRPQTARLALTAIIIIMIIIHFAKQECVRECVCAAPAAPAPAAAFLAILVFVFVRLERSPGRVARRIFALNCVCRKMGAQLCDCGVVRPKKCMG